MTEQSGHMDPLAVRQQQLNAAHIIASQAGAQEGRAMALSLVARLGLQAAAMGQLDLALAWAKRTHMIFVKSGDVFPLNQLRQMLGGKRGPVKADRDTLIQGPAFVRVNWRWDDTPEVTGYNDDGTAVVSYAPDDLHVIAEAFPHDCGAIEKLRENAQAAGAADTAETICKHLRAWDLMALDNSAFAALWMRYHPYKGNDPRNQAFWTFGASELKSALPMREAGFVWGARGWTPGPTTLAILELDRWPASCRPGVMVDTGLHVKPVVLKPGMSMVPVIDERGLLSLGTVTVPTQARVQVDTSTFTTNGAAKALEAAVKWAAARATEGSPVVLPAGFVKSYPSQVKVAEGRLAALGLTLTAQPSLEQIVHEDSAIDAVIAEQMEG